MFSGIAVSTRCYVYAPCALARAICDRRSNGSGTSKPAHSPHESGKLQHRPTSFMISFIKSPLRLPHPPPHLHVHTQLNLFIRSRAHLSARKMSTAMTTSKSRSYSDAIDCLNSLQSNQAMIQAVRDSGGRLAKYATHETTEYLSRIGYKVSCFRHYFAGLVLTGRKPEDLNKLNVLHVTGTKGKGSTCAFIDSLLRHSMPQWTVGELCSILHSEPFLSTRLGLYTSPHLVAVRERIRINGKPISEEEFAKYFFEVWDRLEANDTVSHVFCCLFNS